MAKLHYVFTDKYVPYVEEGGGKWSHDDFIAALRLKTAMTLGFDNSNGSCSSADVDDFLKSPFLAMQEYEYDEGDSHRCPPMGEHTPDMYYVNKDHIIIGEAKADKDDLRDGYDPRIIRKNFTWHSR